MVAVIDDCDNQHGSPNVAMVQKVMMTADDNDMKCNFGPPCFTQMMSIAVTDWDESNCSILFNPLVTVLYMVWDHKFEIEIFGIKPHNDDANSLAGVGLHL